MTRKLDESTIEQIQKMLSERFGDPIGKMDSDGQGVPSSRKKKNMGNRGLGAKFEAQICQNCGHMADDIDEADTCSQCGMMRTDLDEKAPPGREKQVKALKKNKNIDNPWAVAWASYNKSH
jgi:hypothetical protein